MSTKQYTNTRNSYYERQSVRTGYIFLLHCFSYGYTTPVTSVRYTPDLPL